MHDGQPPSLPELGVPEPVVKNISDNFERVVDKYHIDKVF